MATDLTTLTVKGLREFAQEYSYDIRGLRTKAEITAAISDQRDRRNAVGAYQKVDSRPASVSERYPHKRARRKAERQDRVRGRR